MQKTERLRKTTGWLVIAAILLTLGDAACTAAGITLGVIAEGNPIWRSAMQNNPVMTGIAALIYTSALLAVVYRFGHRCRLTVPLLIGLVAVKTAVMGLHLFWMAML